MNQEIIKTIIQFLNRTQLSGGEVPAFVQCLNELNALLSDPPPAKDNDKEKPA